MESKLPEFLRPYFWDVKFEELNVSEHWYLVLKRVLDRGDASAVRWVRRTYGDEKIKDVLMRSRDLDVMTANFWADVLGLDKNEVPCLNKPFSPIHFGLYS